jgi:hypothetical protein
MNYEKFTLWEEIRNTKSIIETGKELLKNKIYRLRQLQKGGFSNDIFNLKYVIDYIEEFEGNCLWYIGRDGRKNHIDKRVEKNWKGNKSSLWKFLCSKIGSNFMAEITSKWKKIDILNKYYKYYIEKDF